MHPQFLAIVFAKIPETLIVAAGVVAALLIGMTIVAAVYRSLRPRRVGGRQVCPACGSRLPADAPHGLCPACLLKEGLGGPELPLPNDGAKAPLPTADAGERAPSFPHLEILEPLGKGGMGAVFKARQTKLNRLVALKVLPSESGRDSNFAERFTREAQALARLNHPNIVGVQDFGETNGQYCFIMEYVDGVNLRQLLQKGRMAPQEALAIVQQVCDALQYAHEEGIIHRDIKPENILIDRKGRVKIADFGLAKLVGRESALFQLTGSQQIMGTPHYMAPEQMERPHTVDHRADIFALGVVFYEMLTGELPLGRFALPSEKGVGDTAIDQIVLRALDKNPDQRYQKISEVQHEVAMLQPGVQAAPVVTLANRSFQDEMDEEMLRLQLAVPAVGLIVTAILALIQWVALGLAGVFTILDWQDLVRFSIQPGSPAGYPASLMRDIHMLETLGIVGLIAVPIALWVLVHGARCIQRLENYPFAAAACVWAMVPWSAAFPVGLTFGIIGLVFLNRPKVKDAFARRAVQARRSHASLASSLPPPRGRVRSFFQAIGSLVLKSRVS